MNFLPKEIEEIIYDYKLDLEIMENRDKFTKSLNNIKRLNYNVYNSRFGTEIGIIVGNIVNRFCRICHNFIITKYKWDINNIVKHNKKHYCNCI